MTSEDEARPGPEPANTESEPTPNPADAPAPGPAPVADANPSFFQAPPSPYVYPHWAPRQPGTNGFAVAAMVVGIVGLFFCFGFLGMIFGYIARRQIEETGQAGEGMATAGIVLGWIAVALIAIRLIVIAGASVGAI